ncbi:hypothetical protein T4D_12404 [Trichinella pseudospiralis]|uniref:Uncharacterized protein n=1 Tax=Trichinella pseudospiralis TaxID=6337 RepID=A0A0V1FIU9_TRIPS|nr:hypothetical protein T4D_12404 [Trichinella pseudospiralis]
MYTKIEKHTGQNYQFYRKRLDITVDRIRFIFQFALAFGVEFYCQQNGSTCEGIVYILTDFLTLSI